MIDRSAIRSDFFRRSRPAFRQLRRDAKRRGVALSSAACAALVAGIASADQAYVGQFGAPTIDRWNYPFNQTPGDRASASIFGAFVGEDLSPDFDNRDAQFLIAFETSDQIEPGLGADTYEVTEARVRLMISNDLMFQYDATFDPWQTYLPSDHPDHEADSTPGRPIELFGVGFRNGFGPLSYLENTPYSPIGPFGKGHRTAFAADMPSVGEARDVSNNIDGQFETLPWAIGQTDDVSPGALVPEGAVFIFEIDVSDPAIQARLREAMDLGRVHFMAASLFPAAEKQTGSFPEFYCKENLLVIAGIADAASLELYVKIGGEPQTPGDLNGDGAVNVFDLLELLSQWGACADCPGDLNGDEQVNVFDLLILLSNWG